MVYGSSINRPTTTSYPGYTLAGWLYEPLVNGQLQMEKYLEDSDPFTSSIRFYADWVPVTIKFKFTLTMTLYYSSSGNCTWTGNKFYFGISDGSTYQDNTNITRYIKFEHPTVYQNYYSGGTYSKTFTGTAVITNFMSYYDAGGYLSCNYIKFDIKNSNEGHPIEWAHTKGTLPPFFELVGHMNGNELIYELNMTLSFTDANNYGYDLDLDSQVHHDSQINGFPSVSTATADAAVPAKQYSFKNYWDSSNQLYDNTKPHPGITNVNMTYN